MFLTQLVPSMVYFAWGKICTLALDSFKRGSVYSLGYIHLVNISADWNSAAIAIDLMISNICAFLSKETGQNLIILTLFPNKSSFTKFLKQQGTILSRGTVKRTEGILLNTRLKKKKNYLECNINTVVLFSAYENIDIGCSAYSLSARVFRYISVSFICLITRIVYWIRKFILESLVIREKNMVLLLC